MTMARRRTVFTRHLYWSLYDGVAGRHGSYIELISAVRLARNFLDQTLLYGECYCWDRRKPLVGKTF